MQSLTILVTGATGNIGKAAVAELAGRGARVVVATRDVQKSEQQFAGLAGVRSVLLDLDRPDTIDAALAGVDAVFAVSPLGPEIGAQTERLVAAARRAGVRRIVRSSVLGADTPEQLIEGAWHNAGDDAVRRSGLSYTILRPNQFFQNFINFGVPQTVAQQGAIYQPLADCRVSNIDTRDIATIAANVLLDPGESHAGREYDLTGGSAQTMHEIAAAIAEALGKPVQYVAVPDAPVQEALSAAGLPAPVVAAIVDWFAFCRAGKAARVTEDARTLLGRAPIDAQQFARDHVEHYRG